MAVRDVVTMGYGSYSRVGLIPVLGYGLGSDYVHGFLLCGTLTVEPLLTGDLTIVPLLTGDSSIVVCQD